MQLAKPNILVLDDDSDITALLVDLLESRFIVRTAHSETEAIRAIQQRLPDVFLSDYHLGATTSEALLRVVARRFPAVRRILMSAAPEDEWIHLCHAGVVEAALQKPFGLEDLLALLDGERVASDVAWS